MKKISRQLISILTSVFAALLCVSLIASNVLNQYASLINQLLGVKTYRVETIGDDTDDDDMYFTNKYSTNTLDENNNLIYNQEGIDALTKAGEAMSEEIESEGLVLLKNDNKALPLGEAKVSLFGQGSADFNYGTTGSSQTNTSNYENFKTALENVGITVNPTLWNYYSGNGHRRSGNNPYIVNEAPWNDVNNHAASFGEYSDAAVVVIARNSGEGSDLSATGSDTITGDYLTLTQAETDLLKGLKASGKFTKIIVILNTATAVQLDFLDNPDIKVDALMWVGNVGKTGIRAVAKALKGDVVPSGRLSDTYVKDNFSSPAAASLSFNANKKFAQKYAGDTSSLTSMQYYYGVYVEGVYVGYRYYETRYEDVVMNRPKVGNFNYSSTVAYPFGSGLSYAKFEYSDFNVTEAEKDGEEVYEISVKVTNTSDEYDGKEVVQIYLQKPYVESTGLEKPSVELVGFAKTGVLKHDGSDAEKSEVVKITVSKEQFASYDVEAKEGKGGYVLDAGNYYLAAGKDSHDALNNILAAKAEDGLSINASAMTSAGNSAFTYKYTQKVRDEHEFALSAEEDEYGNKKEIVNQLDFADVNRYDGAGDNSVTYVTRSDWEGSFPKSNVVLTINDQMIADLARNKELPTETTEERPTYGAQNGLTLAMLRSTEEKPIPYDSSEWEDLLDQMTFEDQSLLLTNAYMGSVEITSVSKPATADADGPTAVINNSNGGSSLTGTSFPSEGIWAATFNIELIERAGQIFAEDALYNGKDILYATGVNIHRMPFGGRVHEYFSEDPFLAGVAVSYEIAGMHSRGVLSTLKHFAFNDEEDCRAGICVWLNEQAAREIYLKPFEIAMRQSKGNAHAIMTSFNRAGCIWTSASSELMINISRDEWRFDGYSITDMADSSAWYMQHDDGIMNGTDLFLGYGDENTLADYSYSTPYCLRMREACHRVLYVIANYSAAMNGMSANSRIVPVVPGWQIAATVEIIVLSVLTAAGAVLWITKYVLAAVENKRPAMKSQANERIKN